MPDATDPRNNPSVDAPSRIEFRPGGIWRPVARLAALWHGSKASAEAWAVIEGHELRLRGRPDRAVLALRRGVTVPLASVTGPSGDLWSGGDHGPLRVHYVEGRRRPAWVVGRELEGGTHSFREAIAAIVVQQRVERGHPDAIRGEEGARYRRRIDFSARFAERTGQPGFTDHRDE